MARASSDIKWRVYGLPRAPRERWSRCRDARAGAFRCSRGPCAHAPGRLGGRSASAANLARADLSSPTGTRCDDCGSTQISKEPSRRSRRYRRPDRFQDIAEYKKAAEVRDLHNRIKQPAASKKFN